MSNLVTCTKCGWVSYAVTRAEAEAEVALFSEYYHSLPRKEQLSHYGGKPSTLSDYCCQFCAGSEFRPMELDDCPDGCTVSPVICEL